MLPNSAAEIVTDAEVAMIKQVICNRLIQTTAVSSMIKSSTPILQHNDQDLDLMHTRTAAEVDLAHTRTTMVTRPMSAVADCVELRQAAVR